MRAAPLPILTDFEHRTNLGPTFAARLLGIPYITYSQYRSGARPWKPCHQRHIEVILLLDPAVLAKVIQEHAHGS